MRKILQVLMVLTALVAIPLTTQATPAYTNLYVFGDSYCDVGNIFTATGGAEPAAPYYAGRFSNGPIWVDHIAGFLGVTSKASLLGGTNYAFGGAWVTAPQSIPGGVIPSVPQQVEMYLAANGGKADPKALYILEGGGNDILNTTTGSPEALAFQIALGIADSELALRRAGARHFLVPNLFNVGLLPAGQANAAFDAQASNAVNQYLNEMLGVEQLLEGIHILRIDVFSLMNSIGTDPTHFGFSDITDPCLTTALCADPDHTYFWDTHHPTEFGHGYFAVATENVLATQTF
jgi:outer membrane lipase/esterase